MPNFIKIDVDGFENEILQGAKKVLNNKNLISVIIEYEFKNNDQKNKLIELMLENGLSLILISDWVEFTYDNSEIRNFIFLRK